MKLHIFILIVLLVNLFVDFLYYCKGVPCRYLWLFHADFINVIFCLGLISLEGKIKHLRKEILNEKI